jgi:o-succinylbenzoate---CoA ligase
MDGYTQETLWLNGRTIAFADIISGDAETTTDFERDTLDFITAWVSGQQTFTVHTSGSTGTPKDITITRDQLTRSAQRTLQALQLNPSDTALVCLNTKYIAGKMMIVRALIGGMNLIAVEPSSNPMENLPANLHVDFMAVVPLQLQAMLSSPETIRLLHTMSAIIVGGAAVSEELKKELHSIRCPVYATFGMTETISHVALQLLNTINRSALFQTLPGVTIQLDDRGCLEIHDAILPDPVITNDLVAITDENAFRFLGRIDHVINSGGIKIFPQKIEEVVAHVFTELGIERNHLVTGISHDTLGQQVVLIVEGMPLTEEEERVLRSALSEKLPPYEVPRKMVSLPSFVYTETGKFNVPAILQQASKE